jgi:hypothetical protein
VCRQLFIDFLYLKKKEKEKKKKKKRKSLKEKKWIIRLLKK